MDRDTHTHLHTHSPRKKTQMNHSEQRERKSHALKEKLRKWKKITPEKNEEKKSEEKLIYTECIDSNLWNCMKFLD